jgi:hypothetical protein
MGWLQATALTAIAAKSATVMRDRGARILGFIGASGGE